MKQKPAQIDRDEFRAAVRRLGNDQVFYMLDDAIEMLPAAKLGKIPKNHLDLKTLQPDGKELGWAVNFPAEEAGSNGPKTWNALLSVVPETRLSRGPEPNRPYDHAS